MPDNKPDDCQSCDMCKHEFEAKPKPKPEPETAFQGIAREFICANWSNFCDGDRKDRSRDWAKTCAWVDINRYFPYTIEHLRDVVNATLDLADKALESEGFSTAGNVRERIEALKEPTP